MKDPMRIPLIPMVLVGLFSITHYVITLYSLEAQGRAFEMMGTGQFDVKYVLQLIAAYGLFQVAGRFFILLHMKVEEWATLRSREEAWAALRPKAIHHEDVEQAESFYVTVIDNLPRVTMRRLDMVQNYATAIGILCIFLYRIYVDRFWMALAILPVISGLTFVASGVCEEQFEMSLEQSARARPLLMKWLGSYFRSSRERTFNWQQSSVDASKDFYHREGQRLLRPMREAFRWDLLRDVAAVFLVDLPYIGIIVGCMAMAATGRFSLGQVVVWIGILNFVVQGNNALKNNQRIALELRALQSVVDDHMRWIREAETSKAPLAVGPRGAGHRWRFALNDGSEVVLGDEPGIYPIRGANGSGKSTLVNVAIGFQRTYERWNAQDIEALRASLGSAVRIIERDPTIYPNLTLLQEQVLGPGHEQTPLAATLRGKLSTMVPPDIAEKWHQKLVELEARWTERFDRMFPADHEGESAASALLSSGEKVCLSFLRMASQWEPSVKVVVADECDSFLDKETQQLFQRTLEVLSQQRAIYYISHMS